MDSGFKSAIPGIPGDFFKNLSGDSSRNPRNNLPEFHPQDHC